MVYAGARTTVELSYLPVLVILRDLYAQPRDMNRFRSYLATMLQGTDDVVVPITVANPMAKEHALAKAEELLALGADEVGAATTEEAGRRLAAVPGAFKVSLVLADDAGGGWTNRSLLEAQSRFALRIDRKRNFVCALAWTSESPAREEIRETLLGDIYRAAYRYHAGAARTLGAMLEQEGLAGVFAGSRPALPADALAGARAVIAPYLDTTDYAQQFAALYGDEAAVSVGYSPLGLPPRAGFQVALADAGGAGRDPVAVLAALSAASTR
ncbi:MAG TPA: hypothetical protein VHS99_00165 [Chloroflexota bacterium]|nr:hypothetical protein [Chloroflexota bacterium]